jgi:hypothetical protein
MALSHTDSFYSYELSTVHRGSLEIHAPTLADVIQINAPEADGKTQLKVRNGSNGLDLHRIDEKPIQVEVNSTIEDPSSPLGVSYTRERVFTEEVQGGITFRKENNLLWLAAGEGLIVEDVNLLQRFASDLGVFVSRKQEAKYRRLRLAKKFQKLFQDDF